MSKDHLIGLVILSSLMTVIGFILLSFSVKYGTSLAENWLIEQGGADTSTYLIVKESYIHNFLTAGGILFGIGLATTIFASYKILSLNQ